MSRFAVTTVIDAYDTYYIEAETAEEASRLIRRPDVLNAAIERGDWREDGYGDRLEIVAVAREAPDDE